MDGVEIQRKGSAGGWRPLGNLILNGLELRKMPRRLTRYLRGTEPPASDLSPHRAPGQPVDFGQISVFSDADPIVTKELVRVFLQQSDAYLATLGQSLEQGDCRKWQETVASLQECSNVVGAKSFNELCKNAKSWETSIEHRTKYLALLRAEHKRVCACLARFASTVP